MPLPVSVAEVIEEHQRRFPPHPDGFLFTNGRGALPRRNSFGEMWRNAVRRAGLTRMVHFHDLRHFYASLLIHHGESVKVVQARLGHASVTETLDTYVHLWPDNGDRTRAAINEVLSDALGSAQSISAGVQSAPESNGDRPAVSARILPTRSSSPPR